MPIDLSPDFLFFLGILLAFLIGSYIFVRRILVSFRQGLEEGRR